MDIAGRTSIVINDGLATGATMVAALHATRRAKPKHPIMAVPVAPPDAIDRWNIEADDVVWSHNPALFGAIGLFYRELHELSDDEVLNLLKHAKTDEPSPSRHDKRSGRACARPLSLRGCTAPAEQAVCGTPAKDRRR